MKSSYLNYLNSLPKEKLIDMLYFTQKSKSFCTETSTRNIALEISFEGKNFSGIQHHENIRSITDCLNNALELSNLKVKEDLVFCGRTDKGVSAISMVASLTLKSRLKNPNRTYKIVTEDYEEYPYDLIINAHLPFDMKIMGWAPVPDTFSARFDCLQRQYRYYFVKNELDLDKMNLAVDKISKMTNFYKLSTHSNPKAIYDRELDFIKIVKCNNSESNYINDDIDIENYNNILSIENTTINNNKFSNTSINDDLYYLDIRAKGFLHNMVRKIFFVLKNCGKGLEFSLENVEKAEPENLVFIQGIFKEKLNFIISEKNENNFKELEENERISYEIAKIRNNYYNQNK